SDIRPKSPNETDDPRHASPRIRPRCCLRYLTFFGININAFLYLWIDRSINRSMDLSLSAAAGRAPRLPILFLAARLWREALALVEPHLHADLSVGRPRFREAVVDVRAERLQRQLAVQVPLGARDFGAVQAAGHPHLDALGAEAQRRLDGLAHRTPERHAFLELHGDRFTDELRVELGLLNLEDVDEHLAARRLLQLLPELVHFRALAADDDARPRRVDVDLQLVRRALDVDP